MLISTSGINSKHSLKFCYVWRFISAVTNFAKSNPKGTQVLWITSFYEEWQRNKDWTTPFNPSKKTLALCQESIKLSFDNAVWYEMHWKATGHAQVHGHRNNEPYWSGVTGISTSPSKSIPRYHFAWSYDQANQYLSIDFRGGIGFRVHRLGWPHHKIYS